MLAPVRIWIGRVSGEWPIVAFDDEDQAVRWLSNPASVNAGVKRLWLHEGAATEMILTERMERRLIPRESGE